MKYRKKPVVIEAVQHTGAMTRKMYDFLTQSEGHPIETKGENFSMQRRETGRLVIKTLEGNRIAEVGDFIIRGVKGEFYPCKPDIFEATYEAVE